MAWLLFFLPQILTDSVPFYRDLLITYYPIRDYLHQRLGSGQLPQWYPYESLGVPFIGQIVGATFHPATWLLLAFDPLTALKLNVLGAYLFAAAGTFLLARAQGASARGAVASAIALAFGGYAVAMSNSLVYLTGLATLPWVGWAATGVARRGALFDAVLLAGIWTLLFLCGDAQSFALAPAVVLAAAVAAGAPVKRTAGLGLLAAALSISLAGIELLPALAVSSSSVRTVGKASEALGVAWALHPWRLFELVVPGFVPDAVRARFVSEAFNAVFSRAQWATSVFAGSVVLLLAGFGLRLRRAVLAWGALAALGLVLALGSYGGLLPVAWKLLPLLQRFRYPEKYLAIFQVGLAVLVGFGFDAAVRRPIVAAKAALAGAAGLGLVAALVGPLDLVGVLWAAAGHPLGDGDPLRAVAAGAWLEGLASAAVALSLAAAVMAASVRRTAFAALLPLVLFAELWRGNGAFAPMVDRELVVGENAAARVVKATRSAEDPFARVISETPDNVPLTVTLGDAPRWVESTRRALRPDISGVDGIGAFGNNLPAASVRETMVLGRRGALAPKWGALFDGCYRVTEVARPKRNGDEVLLVDEQFGYAVVRQPCVPRAFLAASRTVSSPAEAFRALETGVVTPQTAVWEDGPALAGGAGTVRWIRYAPEALELEVEAQAASALVVSDAFAPGWTAALDGAPARIFAANVAARGIAVPEGRHRVTMTYRTPLMGTGAALSGAAGVLALALVLRDGVLRRLRARRA